jgi:hypothetical protein
MSRPTAIAVLRALRAGGFEWALQGDRPVGPLRRLEGDRGGGQEWTAECPVCLPGSGGFFLTMTERAEAGPVDLRCSNQCATAEILSALGLNGSGPATAAGGRLRARGVRLDRVEPFRWAWDARLLLGYMNLLVGDEGVGKGTFLAWLIARLTLGDLPGDLQGEPARVLMVGDEDGFDNVTVPRLVAAGAHTEHVLDLPIVDGDALDVARDAANLAELLVAERVQVVVFDQLLDNLGEVDTWKAKEVRAALAPLRRLAADLGVCFLCTLHTNKSNAPTFRQRIADSQAFNAVSRSTLYIAEHPDDQGRRVVVRGKGNYAPPSPALEFTIASGPLQIGGHVHRPGRVSDLRESEVTLADLLAAGPPTTTKADEARELIREALEDGEWHDAAPIRVALRRLGVSASGIRRAANDVGVDRRRTSGFPSTNEWRLAAPSPTRARGGAPTGPTGPTGPTASASRSSGSSGSSGSVPARTREASARATTEGDTT